jgi:hypothetical protein
MGSLHGELCVLAAVGRSAELPRRGEYGDNFFLSRDTSFEKLYAMETQE